ncbi:winged helix-turn-helix domain-containing protein [Chitinophaga horti]|uniref:Winged helix-turn-helix domain-containing protein n=1 Tax=Chitinophaga horti TaxID=2920382 RepID=A0ABY6J5P2_9BACT|nr:winged helix-turn-helix domain-containing protein [Chitinophaga horti]UYQ94995.1 winged helix-turn-helix domain-containing protein [Chitinophaga horti]
MRLRQNPLSGKRKYLFGSLLCLFVAVICVAFTMESDDDFGIARREVLLRRIGHELLLLSGDSTSRVLPVEKIAENEYQVKFENAFTFAPASLISTTRRVLAQDPLTGNYVVNVLNAGTSSVTYAYAVSRNEKNDIVTCVGRQQPRAHYMINFKFEPTTTNTAKTGFLLGSLPFLALVGFVFLRPDKPRRDLPGEQEPVAALPVDSAPVPADIPQTSGITLGSVLFDANGRKLLVDEKTIDLTLTETRVLAIFASAPNEIIERSRLQKEIWEDEGVIVGRSLDMFISKLRKKLEADPAIRIVVVRGKGYRLEIGAVK